MFTAFFAACVGTSSNVALRSETPRHRGFRTLAGGAPDAGRRLAGGASEVFVRSVFLRRAKYFSEVIKMFTAFFADHAWTLAMATCRALRVRAKDQRGFGLGTDGVSNLVMAFLVAEICCSRFGYCCSIATPPPHQHQH